MCVIRQVALLLIRERSRLVTKLLETRKHCTELERELAEERERVQNVSIELDRQLAECDQLCGRLSCAESLNRSLQAELSQLQSLPQMTATVGTGLNRTGNQSPRVAVTTTPTSDLHLRLVSKLVLRLFKQRVSNREVWRLTEHPPLTSVIHKSHRLIVLDSS